MASPLARLSRGSSGDLSLLGEREPRQTWDSSPIKDLASQELHPSQSNHGQTHFRRADDPLIKRNEPVFVSPFVDRTTSPRETGKDLVSGRNHNASDLYSGSAGDWRDVSKSNAQASKGRIKPEKGASMRQQRSLTKAREAAMAGLQIDTPESGSFAKGIPIHASSLRNRHRTTLRHYDSTPGSLGSYLTSPLATPSYPLHHPGIGETIGKHGSLPPKVKSGNGAPLIGETKVVSTSRPKSLTSSRSGDEEKTPEISVIPEPKSQMFMHYTIAEDRCGGDDVIRGTILARLGARSEENCFQEKPSSDLALSQRSGTANEQVESEAQLLHHNASTNTRQPSKIPRIQKHIFTALQSQGPFGGWQANISVNQRATQVKLLVDNLVLIRPPVTLPRAVEVSLQFERKCFSQSSNMDAYRRECDEKLGKIRAGSSRQ